MTRRLLAARAAPAAVLLLLALTACSGGAAAPVRLTPSASTDGVESGIVYRTVDGTQLRLDACLPDDGGAADRPAVVLLHGGGFTSGDRSTGGSRTVCQLIAGYGVAAFSIDYRLVPDGVYPDQVDDVEAAIRWLRDSAQVQRFGIDPDRIGLFGSSAGAILAQTVATSGSGSLTTGSRVKAVVSLSGVSDFRPSAVREGAPAPELQQIVLAYLGCKAVAGCRDAAAASPITAVDPTDPPMLLVNGSDEIVPGQQARAMDARLKAAGVTSRLVIESGSAHGYALLDSRVRDAVKTFLEAEL